MAKKDAADDTLGGMTPGSSNARAVRGPGPATAAATESEPAADAAAAADEADDADDAEETATPARRRRPPAKAAPRAQPRKQKLGKHRK